MRVRERPRERGVGVPDGPADLRADAHVVGVLLQAYHLRVSERKRKREQQEKQVASRDKHSHAREYHGGATLIAAIRPITTHRSQWQWQ